MNDSTIPPQHGPSAEGAGGPHGQPQPPTGFFQWIRNLGIVRNSNDRWFAGVASGIAKKANIDPLIVRGVFIVLALLGGPGLLLYLFGWLFLPDMTGKIHAEDLMRGRSTPGVVIGAIIVAVWIIFGIFSPWDATWWQWGLWNSLGVPEPVTVTLTVLFWIAIACVGAYFVHRAIVQHGNAQRAQTTESASAGSTAAPSSESPQAEPHAMGFTEHATQSAQNFGEKAEAWGHNFSEKAEAWGKDFGEKSEAWGKDFSEKTDAWSAEYAARHEHTHMPKGQLLITIALALLAAGGASLWVASSGMASNTVSPAVIAGIIAATIVLSLSMIIAGARGRRSGSVGFLGFVGVIAILVTVAMPWGSRFSLFSNQVIGNESPGVAAVAGNLTVDLTEFDGERHLDALTVTQVFGNVDVTVPEHRPTVITVRLTAGQIHLTETDHRRAERTDVITSGVFTDRTFTFNQAESGDPLNVTVNVGAGNVALSYDPIETRNSTPTFRLEESR